MKATCLKSVVLTSVFLFSVVCANAQIRYNNGYLTIGNTSQFGLYNVTMGINGVYMNVLGSNFFQIDLSPSNPRLAGTGDWVVFYNTQTNAYNSIKVKSVYNYSDASGKTNVQPLSNSLSTIMAL